MAISVARISVEHGAVDLARVELAHRAVDAARHHLRQQTVRRLGEVQDLVVLIAILAIEQDP